MGQEQLLYDTHVSWNSIKNGQNNVTSKISVNSYFMISLTLGIRNGPGIFIVAFSFSQLVDLFNLLSR